MGKQTNILLFGLYLFLASPVIAQETNQLYIISEPQIAEGQLIRSSDENRDANGRLAAGLKVLSDLPSLTFNSNNGVLKQNQNPGSWLLFLSPNERVVTIYATGFEPKQIILNELGIDLESGKVWQIRVTGELPNAFLTGNGNFVLETDPPGATVNIAGIPDLEVQTPHRFEGYAAQEFQVTLTKPNYDTLKYTMEVKNGETVNEVLNLAPSFGFLSVNVVDNDGQPIEHANISMDSPGTLQDPPSIDGFSTVHKGLREIKVTANGYEPTSTIVTVGAEEKQEVTVTLEKRFSFIEFRTVNTSGQLVPNTQINTDSAEVITEEEEEAAFIPLASGEQMIQFTAEGYQPKEAVISVPEGERYTREVILLKPSEYNLLPSPVTVITDEKADIAIDGQTKGTGTLTETLEPGQYIITLNHPYDTITKEIFVEPNQDQEFYLPVLPSRKKALALSAIPGMGHIYTNRQRGWAYLGLTALSAGIATYQWSRYTNYRNELNSTINEYQSAQNEENFPALRSEIVHYQSKQNLFYDNTFKVIYTGLGVYALSLVDIMLFDPMHGYRNSAKIKLIVTEKVLGMNFNISF